jgi:hypothetical protein
VGLRIHLALEDLLGTLYGQDGNVIAQAITQTLDFLGGILLGLGHDAGLFGLGFAASLFDQCRRLLFGFDHAGMVFRLGGSFDQTDARLGLGQIGLAFVGSRKAIGNFLAPVVHCFRERRPYEFHRKPTQHEKHDHLKKESRV